MSCQSTRPERSDGFTLIEALVALAIVAIALAPIASLIATSARGVRSIQAHLIRLQTARTIMTALPSRDELMPGILAGALGDERWRVDVAPFLSSKEMPPQSQWTPQKIVIAVQAPRGAAMTIETVRLQRIEK